LHSSGKSLFSFVYIKRARISYWTRISVWTRISYWTRCSCWRTRLCETEVVARFSGFGRLARFIFVRTPWLAGSRNSVIWAVAGSLHSIYQPFLFVRGSGLGRFL
jgi:hypothetical protein